MDASAELLSLLDLPTGDSLALSEHSFPDGGSYRLEIPSVEGPAALLAVVDEAARLDVAVHRVSQGSGIMMLTDAELRDMAQIGAEHLLEVCLFVGPRAPWEGGASAIAPDGGHVGFRHSGMDQLLYALRDVARAADAGIRSVLAADEGLIWLIQQGREKGYFPADLVVKGSAALGISNPVQARVLEAIGMDTANVNGDTSLARLASLRRVIHIPIDLYIEGPDGLGGFMRYHEIAEVVRVAAPVYLKFGLRNSPGIYPAGGQLEAVVLSSARERVHRARIGIEHLQRGGEFVASPTDSARAGVPERVGAAS